MNFPVDSSVTQFIALKDLLLANLRWKEKERGRRVKSWILKKKRHRRDSHKVSKET